MENCIWKHETSLLSCNIQTWHLWIHAATAATPFQRVARRPGCQATAWKPAQVSTRLDEILKSEILSASPRCCEKQWGSSLSGNWSHRARTAQDSYRDRVDWLIVSIIWRLMTIRISVPLTSTLITSGSRHPRLPKLLALLVFQTGMLHESRPDSGHQMANFTEGNCCRENNNWITESTYVAHCGENSRIAVGSKWVQNGFKMGSNVCKPWCGRWERPFWWLCYSLNTWLNWLNMTRPYCRKHFYLV